MDIGQTLLIFFIEAVIFITILTACLSFAAKRHRNHLKDVIRQVNQSKLFKTEQEIEQKRSKHLVGQLKEKLSRLQQQISMLERIEKKYYALKDKYDEDTNALKAQLADALGSAEADTTSDGKKYVIKAGTTADRESGVDPAYLSYLSRKSSISDAGEYTQRVSHESRVLNKKIQEQQDVIQTLKKDLKSAQLTSEVDAIKGSGQGAALNALHSLEDSLNKSQTNGRELESSLNKLKRELTTANDKVAVMEMKLAQPQDSKTDTGKSDIVINAKYSEIRQSEEMETIDRDMAVALRDYQKIKREVETLRQNTSQQRHLIFVLEKEILELRNAMKDGSLSQEEQEAREAHIARLEKVLKETEGCVEVLESEVSYLQDKLVDYGKDDQVSSLQEMYDKAVLKLQRTQNMLDRAIQVRASLVEIIALGRLSEPKAALERLSEMLMALFDKLDVAVHLRMIGQFGEIEASNSKGFDADQIEFLVMSLHRTPDTAIESDQGFIVCANRIGAYVKAPLTAETSLGKLRDTVQFIVSVSNSVITHLEEKQSAHIRQSALRRLVEAIRQKISTISIQSRYQSEEAKNIFSGLINEINATLSTLNMSKTQSEYFTQMIDETKQRMSLLLANEIVVDKSFTALLDRIENSTATLTKK